MLHPVRVPPASGSLPPWMFPRGIPSAALHTKQQVPSGGRSRASPIHGSLSLAFSARNMPPASRAAVPAYPRFRSAPPPPASPPPPPQRCSTPRLRHRAPPASNSFFFSRQSFTPHNHRRTSHHASSPPRFPSRCVRKCASSKAEMSSEFSPRAAVSGRYGVKRCPRHSRRFRTPKVVCAAWSFLRERLTPRPTTAKSHYRLLWSANFVRHQEEQLVSS